MNPVRVAVGMAMGKVIKLYESEVWLRRKYLREKLSEQEIAEQAGCSQPTINRALRKFGLKK